MYRILSTFSFASMMAFAVAAPVQADDFLDRVKQLEQQNAQVAKDVSNLKDRVAALEAAAKVPISKPADPQQCATGVCSTVGACNNGNCPNCANGTCSFSKPVADVKPYEVSLSPNGNTKWVSYDLGKTWYTYTPGASGGCASGSCGTSSDSGSCSGGSCGGGRGFFGRRR